jgi:hypothetical protein
MITVSEYLLYIPFSASESDFFPPSSHSTEKPYIAFPHMCLNKPTNEVEK